MNCSPSKRAAAAFQRSVRLAGTRERGGANLSFASAGGATHSRHSDRQLWRSGGDRPFGPKYGLPAAISGHQTYYFWGPRHYTDEVVIVLQNGRKDLETRFASVQYAGEHYHKWGMAEENAPIYVCRGVKRPLAEVWPRTKHWN